MNLVKAQALANDLPIQELKKYADGFDPRIIPPWVAAGTMQSKMDLQKRMQNMIGGAQGNQPSVKEQIEQKAGLMAANTMQQRQQQAQQQMAMASRPGPAPEGVPQPEDQPEAPVQMARGGLTSVPVQFAFKPGGIVAFSNGGDTMGTSVSGEQDLASQASELALAERRRAKIIEELEKKAEFLDRAGAPQADAVRAQLEAFKSSGVLPQPQSAAPRQEQPRMTSPQPAAQTYVRGAAPRPEAASRQVAAPRAETAPRPAQPAQTGLPAAANTSPFLAQAAAALNEPNVKPTPESIIAEQKALSPEAMLEENMRKRYEERKARADQERAAFERTRPTGLQDLIRVLGQSAQYKGMSGLAPAYTANLDRKRAEELALEKRMNELYNAADVQEFEGAKELFGARTKSMEAANRSYQDRLKSRSETLAQLAGVDQRRIDEALGRLTQTEIAKMRAADAGGDMRYLAQYLALKADGKDKQADALLESFTRFKRGEPKPDPLQSALSKEYAEQLGAALQLPAGKLRDERMAGLKLLEQRINSGGAGNAGKVMTRDDVAATAKASGKTEQQVIDAAKAQGYTIR